MVQRRFGPASSERRRTQRDRALAQRLFDVFERDLELVDIQDLHFLVQNGTVTLHGSIRHELDRDVLVSLVREIAGVKGVVSRIHVADARTAAPRPFRLVEQPAR